MNNDTILNNRWRYTDKKLKEYLKVYKNLNARTQDKIQDIFNGISFNYIDLNKSISKSQQDKLNRIIEEWKKKNLLTGYFKYQVELLMKKKSITNQEMLDILLWGTYLGERKELDEYEKILFIEIGTNLYQQGIDEIKPTKKKKWSLTWAYIWSLLCLPNIRGYTWKDYVEALTLTNSQEIGRQAKISLQQNKKPDMEDEAFRNIIKKQQNRYISINDDKYSGALENQVIEVANDSFIKAGTDTKQKKLMARFIAEIDDKTTPMCRGMNGMLFHVNDWNRFYRWSAIDGKDVYYTCYGLEKGVNLPPINNHFHYCRSTITYLTNMKYNELLAEYNQLRRIIPSEVPEKFEEYADLRYNKDGYYEEIKDKEEVGKHYNKHYEIRKEDNPLNIISFNTYYNGYTNTKNELSNINVKNIGSIRLSTHAYDRILERDVSIDKIKEVLKELPTFNKKNDSMNYQNEHIMVAIGNKTHDIATIINFEKGSD